MTTRLRLAKDFTFPLELVTESVAILARKRAGKSNTAKVLVEQLFRAKQQIVVVDPKGDWWGLRFSRDGKGPGLPVIILGGHHADVPLEAGSGQLVARLVVHEAASIVLDLSKFSKGERHVFMTAFLETLYRLKAEDDYRTPMMLAIDEADQIAPQRPQKGEERMLGAADDIVRLGGQRGIGVILVSQRSAVLNKNVLTQVSILITLQTTGSQDIDALNTWIEKHGHAEEGEQLVAALPSLPRGTAWVWAPAWPDERGIFRQVAVNLCETFDSGATPKPGERRVVPKTAADVDLEAFRREMAATIEKAKAEDPKELQRQVRELKAEVARASRAAPAAAAKPAKVEKVNVLSDPLARRIEVACKRLPAMLAGVERMIGKLERPVEVLETGFKETIEAARAAERRLVEALTPAAAAVAQPATAPVAALPWRAAPPRPTSPHRGQPVGSVAQRILNALAELEQLGAQKPARELVAMLAGYSNLKSSGFVKAIGELRGAGHVDYPNSDTMVLTAEGQRHAHPPERPRTSEEVQQRIVALIGGTAGSILAPLIKAYPEPMKRDDVAAHAGYGNLKSAGFVKAVGRLRTLGFVDYPDPSTMVAMPVLFLEEQRG